MRSCTRVQRRMTLCPIARPRRGIGLRRGRMTQPCVTYCAAKGAEQVFDGAHEYRSSYGGRSAMAQVMWNRYNREEAIREQADKPAQQVLLTKTPQDSLVQVILPLSTDASLRHKYVNPFGSLAFARVLEDLDALAGHVAYLHADDGDANTRLPTIVTAAVDRIDILPGVTGVDNDLKLTGSVVFVGRSSMVTLVEAWTRLQPQAEWQPVMRAHFTMVARCSLTNRSQPVNRLHLCSDEDEKAAQRGYERKLRAVEKTKGLYDATDEERAMIHGILMNEEDGSGGGGGGVVMSRTQQQSMILCASQERNVHSKIFGGYLMRKALELAWTTAFVFALHYARPSATRQRAPTLHPRFRSSVDITFDKPIDIGSVLDLRACVTYTEPDVVVVEVIAGVHRDAVGDNDGTFSETNRFHFCFDVSNKREHEGGTGNGVAATAMGVLPPVLPVTYREAIKYVYGRRIWLSNVDRLQDKSGGGDGDVD